MAVPHGPPALTPRLRVTGRSIVLTIAALGLTLLVLRMAEGSFRVLGWIAAAAALAGLLHPPVQWLSRFVPRALAVLGLAALLLAGIGLVGYEVVQSIVRETHQIQESAPAQARQIEQSRRFGELATDAHLAERTQRFVDAIPERLQGGSPADAIRAAATRGIAFLATGVLTLFFLLHGARLAGAALNQVAEGQRRDELDALLCQAARRGFGYARGTLAMAVLAGLTGFAMARWAGVPGAAPLGLWLGLWDVVPLVGAVIGAFPIVVLAAVADSERAVVLALVIVVYQVLESVLAQRRLERRTLRLGPFLTAAAAFAGLELYGIGGALLAIVAAALAVATADALAPA